MFFNRLPIVGGFLGDALFPEYHPGMLEVKLKADTGTLRTPMSHMGGHSILTRAAAASLPGIGQLLAYERSGMIRRVVRLSEGVARAVGGETPLLATFAESLAPQKEDDPNAGVSFVELHQDRDTASLEEELRRDPTVESVSRVPVRYLAARVRKTAAAAPAPSSMWNLTKIRWAEARSKPGFKDANAIKVAVLDTGIDMGHPDRPTNIANYEYANRDNASASSDQDIIGHGTHVAGTIAAAINNNVGINGICNCEVSAFKIFDDIPDWHPVARQFMYFTDPVMYHRALSRCHALGVDVVNLSIGGRGAPSSNESLLFSRLIARGTTIVAAMGNENSSTRSYPAAIPGVIAVGATSINDSRARFSNFGQHISLSAPGVGVWSTLPKYAGNMGYEALASFPPRPDFSRPIERDREYAAWDGTSMASPHVAAAVALLLAKRGVMSPAIVRRKLTTSAAKVPGMGTASFSPEFGYGRLDLVKLLS